MISPPFRLLVPSRPQGFWLAESVGAAIPDCPESPARRCASLFRALWPARLLAPRGGRRRRRRIIRILVRIAAFSAAGYPRNRRPHHIGGEEISPIPRLHHVWQFVGQPLRDDFLNQHGVLLQHGRFELHALRVRRSRHPDAVGFGIGKISLPLYFGFAVNDLRLRGGFRVLQRGFLPRLRFQLGLFDLLLLQRQRVLHRVRFRLGLQNAHLRLRLGSLHFTRFF